jgi:hypothetical protein
MTLSKQTPDNDFRPLPELEGAEISFVTRSGTVHGPFILRTKPFKPGATALNGRIYVEKLFVFPHRQAEDDYHAALERHHVYGTPKPNQRDYMVGTGQFRVTVNGKRTERYAIRFPRKRVKKQRFAYI